MPFPSPPRFQCPRVCLVVIRVWALGCFFAPMAFRSFIPLGLLLFAVPYVFLAISSVPPGFLLAGGPGLRSGVGHFGLAGCLSRVEVVVGRLRFSPPFMGWAFGPFWPPLGMASFLSQRVCCCVFPWFGSLLSC